MFSANYATKKEPKRIDQALDKVFDDVLEQLEDLLNVSFGWR